MGGLGDCFPTEFVDKRIADNFKVGSVIRIEVDFGDIAKPKFLVLVADNDPECLTFIINSKTNPFIGNQKDLAKCQVDIDAASHPFLDYDSKIACHEVLKLKRSDVIKELRRDTSKIKGRISDDVRKEILSAVKFAKTLSKRDINTILQSLND